MDKTFVDEHPEGAATRLSLKELMITELNLAGKTPDQLADDASLFGSAPDSLGFDSLDALQLAMCIEERFGVKVPEGDAARPIFASVNALTAHILRTKDAG